MISLQIPEEVELYGVNLRVGDSVSLEYLDTLMLEIDTVSEGALIFPLAAAYQETRDDRHIYRLPVTCQLEVNSVTFWKIRAGHKMAVGKTHILPGGLPEDDASEGDKTPRTVDLDVDGQGRIKLCYSKLAGE